MTSIAGGLVLACSTPKAAEPAKPVDAAPELIPTFTIREIMQSMVEPRADSLWNAVSTEVTAKGPETKAPKNDEEWAKMRHEAVTLSEAMNAILVPGRKVAKPGEQAKDPKVELTPEQIGMLIQQDRASWTKLAKAMQDSVSVAIKAIDAKDADGLSNAGGGMDTACETCHKKYWYPNEEKAGKK
jgi:cytochrome c556